MSDPDATFVPEAIDPAPSPGLVPLVGRYRLGEVLGRGGSGVVYAADDLLTGEQVAVKFVPLLGVHARRQLRRELSALMTLRLPGVVRLRDEGTLVDRSFVVTDRVDGVPFTENAGQGWASWRPRVVGLLDVLARVHLAGVVHRDLKPANVLVDREDRVVILDFGLAQGRLVERSTGGLVEGTPRYMAPEQRAARPCDERTDLYAAGLMILELVTGEQPESPPALDRLRRSPVPPSVVEQVERMLAEHPADRPASALEVLTALGADPRADIGAGMPPGPWTEEQLRALFVDRPKSFLHLAEDAAALLHEEAGGDEAATRLVLDRWIRAGLASWSGDGRVAITRSAIEQIAAGRPGSPQSRLVAMLEAGADPEEVSAEARRIGAEMADAGHLERALAVLDAAELWARGTPSEQGLLEDRVAWSLGLETPQAAERALYRVQRAEIDPELKRKLETLLRGGRAALGGDPRRALAFLAVEPDGLAEPLEIYWHAVRWKAASQLDFETHERELLSMEAWSTRSVVRRSKWQGWMGYLRYRQQRYDESAELLLDAASTRHASRERAQMLYLASAALLEAGRTESARRHGTEARALFRNGRHSLLEALAFSVLRMLDLREGEPSAPDQEVVDAAASFSAAAEGQLALLEGGVAFRCDRFDLCLALCDRAVAALQSSVGGPSLALALALRAAVYPDPSALARVEEVVRGCTPQIEVQVLALLARGFGPRAEWASRARALLPALSGRGTDQRMELVSIREVTGWLGLDQGAG